MALVATTSQPLLRSWSHAHWPSHAGWRWALRGVAALPFLAVACLMGAEGHVSVDNLALTGHGPGAGQFGWLQSAYPPIPRAVGVLVGSPLVLGCFGALLAGVMIQMVVERLLLRSYPLHAAAGFVVTLAATPLFAYVATTDFATFLALVFLSLGLTGLLDFAHNRSTQSGSIAGLAFGLASLCSLAAAAFAVAGGVAAVLVARAVRRPEPAISRAMVALLVFPTAAALLGWTFLEWRFTGSATLSFSNAAPGVGHWGGGPALRSVAVDLALSPLLLGAAAVLARRRPLSAMAAALPVVTLVALGWLGLALSRPASLVLLALVALGALPERPRRGEWVVLGCAAAAQLAVLVGFSLASPAVTSWWSTLR